MKRKLYIHEWQCQGCYSKALEVYSGFRMSTEDDAPRCCGFTPMHAVQLTKVKIKK